MNSYQKEDWSLITKIQVRWGDMDSFNHVNNTIYFKYFETSRIKYFEKIGFHELMTQQNIGPILAHTSCQFILPVQYPDELTVVTKIQKIGNSSFVQEYEIHSPKLGLVAKGNAVCVCYDYNQQTKINIPEEIKQKMILFEKHL